MFSNFVGGSTIDKFEGNVIRPIILSPNLGSINDYFCFYNTWTGQQLGGSHNNESKNIGDFGSWSFIKNNAGSDDVNADIIIVRRSDRKTIQITGNLFYPDLLTITSVINVNYPELQRLRLLGFC